MLNSQGRLGRTFLLEFLLYLSDCGIYNSTGVTIDASEGFLEESDFLLTCVFCRAQDKSPSDQTPKGAYLPGFWGERFPVYVDVGICLFSIHLCIERSILFRYDLHIEKCDLAILTLLVSKLDAWMEPIQGIQNFLDGAFTDECKSIVDVSTPQGDVFGEGGDDCLL